MNFYSDLEFDHWLLVEFNRSITNFCEQPLHVNEYINGERINTVFDMWTADTNNEELFIEVKYASELNPSSPDFSPRSFHQVQSQQLWCQERGYRFEIHTDEWIYENRLYLNNLRKMLPYIDKRKPINDIAKRKVLNAVNDQNKYSIQTLEAVMPDLTKHQVRECICNLIYDGVLTANLNVCEFSKDLEVWKYESDQVY